MKKELYVVAYDVSNDKIRRKVFNTLRSFGTWAEKSVFECELTFFAMTKLKNKLVSLVDENTDILRIYTLTPLKPAIFAYGKVLDAVNQEDFVLI